LTGRSLGPCQWGANPEPLADAGGGSRQTDLSAEISKDLKKRGFKFCGPTIVYAFMQAVGMVNDHVVTCPRHVPVAKMGQDAASRT